MKTGSRPRRNLAKGAPSAYAERIADHERRKAKALAMGSPRKLAELRDAGLLNARERIAALVDADSFTESGLFAVSERPEDRERTPADGVVCGYGAIAGRMVAIAASDFTVVGASSAKIAGRKYSHINKVAREQGLPLVVLSECAGARMPDIMGARGIGEGEGSRNSNFFHRTRANPWVTAVLGPSYGDGVWRPMLSDLVIQRKGAIMAVSSTNVTAVAISEEVDSDSLGGWNMRSAVTGDSHVVVETDLDALAAIKRFLSYLPSHNREAPPRAPVPRGSDDAVRKILDLVPEGRQQVYDVRKVIEAVVDKGSFFPIKERFAKVAVTGLARIDGHAVGIVATNPMVKGGALDPAGCRKITSLIVLCDSFNIPMVFLADTPGFLVGVEGEREGLGGKIMNFIQALEMSTVPRFAIILRKAYGMAYLNMASKHSELAAWFTAEVSFMDPGVGVNVVYGVRRDRDPEKFVELRERLARDTSAYDLGGADLAHAVIDPRETRDYLKRMLAVYRMGRSGGIGEHRLRYWPTSF